MQPNLLFLSRIRVDLLYMKLSISRKILSFIRNQLRGESQKVLDDYKILVLEKFWGLFYISCYESYKNLNCLTGHEISSFICDMIPLIVKFIENRFEVQYGMWFHTIKLLQTW